jgi:hypothetical protein
VILVEELIVLALLIKAGYKCHSINR